DAQGRHQRNSSTSRVSGEPGAARTAAPRSTGKGYFGKSGGAQQPAGRNSSCGRHLRSVVNSRGPKFSFARGRLPMPYTPILATPGSALARAAGRVLLSPPNRRPDDAHFGKYNGLGGKLDGDEDVVAGMRREVREEAGLECEQLRLRGTVSWP